MQNEKWEDSEWEAIKFDETQEAKRYRLRRVEAHGGLVGDADLERAKRYVRDLPKLLPVLPALDNIAEIGLPDFVSSRDIVTLLVLVRLREGVDQLLRFWVVAKSGYAEKGKKTCRSGIGAEDLGNDSGRF